MKNFRHYTLSCLYQYLFCEITSFYILLRKAVLVSIENVFKKTIFTSRKMICQLVYQNTRYQMISCDISPNLSLSILELCQMFFNFKATIYEPTIICLLIKLLPYKFWLPREFVAETIKIQQVGKIRKKVFLQSSYLR